MLTSTHAVIGTWLYRRKFAALCGSVLPDFPILLYFLQARTWSQYPGSWGSVIDAVHSFPLIGAALALSLLLRWEWLATFFGAMGVHAIVDFFTHHDDAHHVLYPFSTFQFRSPLSYWDVAHYGRFGALIEVAIVFAICRRWIRKGVSQWLFWGLIVLQTIYLAAFVYFYFPWR